MESYRESPFNKIPGVVILLCLAVVGIELMFTAAANGMLGGAQGIGWRTRAYQDHAFSTQLWQWMLDSRQFAAKDLSRFVTYPFLHARLGDALLAALMLLAVGKGVADMLTQWAVVVLFVATSIVGALAYGTFVDNNVFLSSAYTPIFGLIGAITYVRWLNLREAGQSQILAFRLIAMFMIFRLVWGLVNLWRGLNQDMQWVAELSGFATGFLLTLAFEPKGWHIILNWVRSR